MKENTLNNNTAAGAVQPRLPEELLGLETEFPQGDVVVERRGYLLPEREHRGSSADFCLSRQIETKPVFWYGRDWTRPSVIQPAPHPQDWGIGDWAFEDISEFIAARKREIKSLASGFGRKQSWSGYVNHTVPVIAESTLIHTSVADVGNSGVALVSANDGHVSEVLVVIPEGRLRANCARHIVRQVKYIPAELRERMFKFIWINRDWGVWNPMAFTIPMPGLMMHAEDSAVHDFQRTLIRAMVPWLDERRGVARRIAA